MNDKQQLIDEYLAGRLPEEMADELEQQMLTDSALQQEVQGQLAFREALKQESTYLLAIPESGIAAKLNRWISSSTWAYTATAGLVIAIGLGIADRGDRDLSKVDGVNAVVRHVELTRSTSNRPLQLPAMQTVVLSIDAYGLGMSSATLYLRDPSGVLVDIELIASEQELFNVVLSPLPPGSYDLEVNQDDEKRLVTPVVVE